MIITNLTTFKNYFKDLATGTNGHVDIKAFFYGHPDRLNEGQRAEADWPLLWLESPDCAPKYNQSATKANFSSAFAILATCPENDFTEQDTKSEACFEIARDLIAKLLEDHTESNIILDPDSFLMNEITHYSISNMFGWRVEFSLPGVFDFCHNPLKFK